MEHSYIKSSAIYSMDNKSGGKADAENVVNNSKTRYFIQ